MGEHDFENNGVLVNTETGETYAIGGFANIPTLEFDSFYGGATEYIPPHNLCGFGTITFENNKEWKLLWIKSKLFFTTDRRARKSLKRKIRKLKRGLNNETSL